MKKLHPSYILVHRCPEADSWIPNNTILTYVPKYSLYSGNNRFYGTIGQGPIMISAADVADILSGKILKNYKLYEYEPNHEDTLINY